MFSPTDLNLHIGLSSYTTPAHIALATLEANAFQTRAILESMKLDSKTDLKHLKVDGGMTNGDMVMKVLADLGGFTVVRPEMRECVLLLLALLSSFTAPVSVFSSLTSNVQVDRTRLRAARWFRSAPSRMGHR